ncbi:DMT family transporter [Streptomyces sp. NPDC008313]|uniref:DMT family transporter n=1 Tax=Streptomyces sp. NPDC008313 TaxID=3364826 RepID=UPI0036EE7342
MAWIVLVVSGVLEAVWATALGRSDGLSRVVPTCVFVAGLTLSMSGLAYALRTVPVGTGYAVWVGIGAVLTASYAMVFEGESAGPLKVLLLLGIIGCVAGLKLTH